ncbi:MAG TPA: hypothetical protein DD806_05120 [Flavobacterium sp.]|nr:hypothetical protein [Flavobacterium sp.]
MANNLILENCEIIQHVSLINFYDGSLEKLDPFVSSVDHLLAHSPPESHAYIIGTILNTKIDSRVRSSLPIQIGNWAQIKNIILEECVDSRNFSKFYTDIIRCRVADYDNLNLFIEDMRKKFIRYKMALQYANVEQIIDQKELIRNLVEQVHKYIEEYIITIAAQSVSYMEALQIIQSKHKNKIPKNNTPENHEIKDLITQVLSYIKREDSNQNQPHRNNQNSSNQNFRQDRNFNQNRNYNGQFNNRNYNEQSNYYRNQNGQFNNNRNYNGQFNGRNHNGQFNNNNNNNNSSQNQNFRGNNHVGQNLNRNSAPQVNFTQMVPQSQTCSHQNIPLQFMQEQINYDQNNFQNNGSISLNQQNQSCGNNPQQNSYANSNPHFGMGHVTGPSNAQ